MREEGRRRVSVNPSRRVVVMQSLWARACYAIKRFFHDKSITKAMFVLLAVDVLLVVTELLMDTQAECVVSSVACRGRDEAASCHSGLGPVMHPDPHAHRGAHGGGHGGQEEMVFSHHVQTLDGGEGVCPAGPLTVEMKLRLFHFLHVWHTPVHLLSIIICGVLLTECALIMLVEGPSHWRNPLYAADFLVLTFSLVIDVFFSHGAEGLQLLFVRVWRFARIFHALFMLAYSVEGEVVQAEAKKVADQFQQEQDALKEQLRKARVQNDRLARELRALKLGISRQVPNGEGDLLNFVFGGSPEAELSRTTSWSTTGPDSPGGFTRHTTS
eukprot:GGOE01003683.1.p1 GENE.GGOE01003683.1~~GGOE01003683.1.p1  ORF type:complete len:328 (-),score=104.02 GGOE01003683.1:312-1295(-)